LEGDSVLVGVGVLVPVILGLNMDGLGVSEGLVDGVSDILGVPDSVGVADRETVPVADSEAVEVGVAEKEGVEVSEGV
jgi:hypothetical protein